jgi:hypothetical protein
MMLIFVSKIILLNHNPLKKVKIFLGRLSRLKKTATNAQITIEEAPYLSAGRQRATLLFTDWFLPVGWPGAVPRVCMIICGII